MVQNGIVENFQVLRTELKEKGCIFDSETDTEVIPHLIASYLPKPTDEEYLGVSPFLKAVLRAIERLEGAFALGVISPDYPDELIVVRQHAPLIIGFGQGEFFCASDVSALVPHTRAVLSLDNGEIARLTPLGVEIYNFEGKRVRKSPRVLDWSPTTVEKQGYRHFMLKEIYEQPGVVRDCLGTYLHPHWTAQNEDNVNPININFSEEIYDNLEHIQILACGTSWHASLVGKYLIEQVKQSIMPVTVLSLYQGAMLMRFVRSSVPEEIHQEYVKTALAKELLDRLSRLFWCFFW